MEQLDAIMSDIIGDGLLLTVQPGGNHGDTLIYKGFDKYTTEHDINTVTLGKGTPRKDRPDPFPSANIKTNVSTLLTHGKYLKRRLAHDISAVYMHGGAGINDVWGGGIRCYTTIARYFDCPIIVGPQSCKFNYTDPTAIFENVDNETYFFCREKYSYDIIKRATTKCDHVSVYLEDDTALFLDAEDLPVVEFDDKYTLLGMRTDRSSASPIIEEKFDSPIKVRDISVAEESYEDWVNEVAKAAHVYTDRLHIMILASILGKQVTAYDVNYHKNRGVYEYSLSDIPDIDFQRLR